MFFPGMSSGDCGFMLSLDLTLQSPGLCVHTIFSPLLGGMKFFSPFNVSHAILAGFVPILGSFAGENRPGCRRAGYEGGGITIPPLLM